MRRRLLLVLLAFSVVAVAGFAVPLLDSTAANRTQRFVLSRTADVARFAALAGSGDDNDQLAAEVAAHTDLYGDGIVVVDAARHVIVESGMRASEPAVAATVDAALRNQPSAAPPTLRPWSSEDVLFSQPVGSGTRVTGAVVLRSSVGPAVADVTARWLGILLGALVALAACVLLVLWLARWVLRPVSRLTEGMSAVASGRAGAHADSDAGPAELRGLAGAFNQMSDAVAESAGRQRQFVADASHQLRNPFAALRLRIDARAAWDAAYEPMVRELDRLEALLGGMLTLATADSKAIDLAAGAADARCDAVAVLADRAEALHYAASAAEVRLTGNGPAELPVSCAESDLAQVVDVVLDNAIKYAGKGATVHWTCRAAAGRALLVIDDDGPGVPAGELSRLTERFWRGNGSAEPGSGLGLAIADRLVTARGGRLTVHNGHRGGLAVHIELEVPR